MTTQRHAYIRRIIQETQMPDAAELDDHHVRNVLGGSFSIQYARQGGFVVS